MSLSWYLGGTSANPNPSVRSKQGPAACGAFSVGRTPLTTTTQRVPPGASGGKTSRISGAITEDITRRVTSAIASTATSRVPGDGLLPLGPFLLLEGILSGALVLEGDGDGNLKIQGS